MNALHHEINYIVEILKGAATFQKQKQPTLRQYVTDKSFPLDERFQVWVAYCDKEYHGCVIHKGEFGLIGAMVDDCWPTDYERYCTYTWEGFLDWIKDEPDVYLNEEKFKEMLIETNFGSFVMDW